jgi:hypothetical protein
LCPESRRYQEANGPVRRPEPDRCSGNDGQHRAPDEGAENDETAGDLAAFDSVWERSTAFERSSLIGSVRSLILLWHPRSPSPSVEIRAVFPTRCSRDRTVTEIGEKGDNSGAFKT